jgi:hypothetical protein
MIKDLNVVEILKVGLPGLVFLLSFLSYRLLSKEQNKAKPDGLMLRSIKFYMYINIAFALSTLASPIIDGLFFAKTKVFSIEAIVTKDDTLSGPYAAVCHNANYANRYLLITDTETLKMIQVLASSVVPCTNGEQHIVISEETARTLLGWTANTERNRVEVAVAPPGFQFVVMA